MVPHPDFEGLDVPTSMMLGDYQLDVLTAADVEIDFETVTRSQPVLQGLFGPTWPDGLTFEENLIDLHWHHREFTTKRSYAWVIRDRTGAYLGCAYLFPKIGGRGSGDAAYWMAVSPERLSHLAAFEQHVTCCDAAPFKEAVIQNRNRIQIELSMQRTQISVRRRGPRHR